jgi:polyphosphate glucokinase
MRILVVDVGGNNVKLKRNDDNEIRRFPSGKEMTPAIFASGLRTVTQGWDYDVVTVGFPSPILHGRIHIEPVNLGPGWVDFDLQEAIGKPLKLINDAAMQALGSYEGGCMLFLGLGTGLGSAMIIDGVIAPLELGHLPYKKKRSFEEYVGTQGLERLGLKKWRKVVFDVVARLRNALNAEYVVLGGGNVKKLDELPPGARLGSNDNAFIGGARLWQTSS